eukprot:gene4721-3412_t
MKKKETNRHSREKITARKTQREKATYVHHKAVCHPIGRATCFFFSMAAVPISILLEEGRESRRHCIPYFTYQRPSYPLAREPAPGSTGSTSPAGGVGQPPVREGAEDPFFTHLLSNDTRLPNHPLVRGLPTEPEWDAEASESRKAKQEGEEVEGEGRQENATPAGEADAEKEPDLPPVPDCTEAVEWITNAIEFLNSVSADEAYRSLDGGPLAPPPLSSALVESRESIERRENEQRSNTAEAGRPPKAPASRLQKHFRPARHKGEGAYEVVLAGKYAIADDCPWAVCSRTCGLQSTREVVVVMQSSTKFAMDLARQREEVLAGKATSLQFSLVRMMGCGGADEWRVIIPYRILPIRPSEAATGVEPDTQPREEDERSLGAGPVVAGIRLEPLLDFTAVTQRATDVCYPALGTWGEREHHEHHRQLVRRALKANILERLDRLLLLGQHPAQEKGPVKKPSDSNTFMRCGPPGEGGTAPCPGGVMAVMDDLMALLQERYRKSPPPPGMPDGTDESEIQARGAEAAGKRDLEAAPPLGFEDFFLLLGVDVLWSSATLPVYVLSAKLHLFRRGEAVAPDPPAEGAGPTEHPPPEKPCPTTSLQQAHVDPTDAASIRGAPKRQDPPTPASEGGKEESKSVPKEEPNSPPLAEKKDAEDQDDPIPWLSVLPTDDDGAPHAASEATRSSSAAGARSDVTGAHTLPAEDEDGLGFFRLLRSPAMWNKYVANVQQRRRSAPHASFRHFSVVATEAGDLVTAQERRGGCRTGLPLELQHPEMMARSEEAMKFLEWWREKAAAAAAKTVPLWDHLHLSERKAVVRVMLQEEVCSGGCVAPQPPPAQERDCILNNKDNENFNSELLTIDLAERCGNGHAECCATASFLSSLCIARYWLCLFLLTFFASDFFFCWLLVLRFPLPCEREVPPPPLNTTAAWCDIGESSLATIAVCWFILYYCVFIYYYYYYYYLSFGTTSRFLDYILDLPRRFLFLYRSSRSAMPHCDAAEVYLTACDRAGAQPIHEFVDILDRGDKVATLSSRTPPLSDTELTCIATAIRRLPEASELKVLSLEENGFGLEGVQALMEALEANPYRIREVRLGKNNLKDQCAVLIGQALARTRCGLKVLDLSENGITKLGVFPISNALESPHCELVELSFHNNKIEGDAAGALAAAMSKNGTLKHLHLGYNTLRDTGAIALAQQLPNVRHLATLDLTANRIGKEGGAALAKALCDSRCGLQRLNLRHNLLDSEGIEAFESVVRVNQSLIQLFLGFMSPTPDAAEKVLDALLDNHTLLLLDVYGWKLHQKRTADCLLQIQRRNDTLAALVTDACQPIAKQIDEGNEDRDDRGVHPLYVGPDDRDAYLATKSLKRFSRAQSRRTSRNASRNRSQSANTSRGDGGGSVSSSVRRVRRYHHAGDTSSRASSSSRGRPRQRVISPGVRQGSAGTPKALTQQDYPTASGTRHVPPPTTAVTNNYGMETEDRDIERLLSELARTPCDGETKRVVRDITESLLAKIKHQRRESRTLLSRIEKLESRRECLCHQPGHNSAPTGSASYRSNVPMNYYSPTPAAAPTTRPVSDTTAASANTRPTAYGAAGYTNPSYPASNTRMGGANSYGPGPSSSYQQQQEFVPSPSSYQQQRRASMGTPGPSSYLLHRSLSRQNDYQERAMTPLVHPSELHDEPPSLARPNEVSGKQRPEETSLQRSASVMNFPPRIEPSPAQDMNPPQIGSTKKEKMNIIQSTNSHDDSASANNQPNRAHTHRKNKNKNTQKVATTTETYELKEVVIVYIYIYRDASLFFFFLFCVPLFLPYFLSFRPAWPLYPRGDAPPALLFSQLHQMMRRFKAYFTDGTSSHQRGVYVLSSEGRGVVSVRIPIIRVGVATKFIHPSINLSVFVYLCLYYLFKYEPSSSSSSSCLISVAGAVATIPAMSARERQRFSGSGRGEAVASGGNRGTSLSVCLCGVMRTPHKMNDCEFNFFILIFGSSLSFFFLSTLFFSLKDKEVLIPLDSPLSRSLSLLPTYDNSGDRLALHIIVELNIFLQVGTYSFLHILYILYCSCRRVKNETTENNNNNTKPADKQRRRRRSRLGSLHKRQSSSCDGQGEGFPAHIPSRLSTFLRAYDKMSDSRWYGGRSAPPAVERWCHGVQRNRQLARERILSRPVHAAWPCGQRTGGTPQPGDTAPVHPPLYGLRGIMAAPPPLSAAGPGGTRRPPETAALRRLEEEARALVVSIQEDFREGHLSRLLETLETLLEHLHRGRKAFCILFLSFRGADALVELLCTAPLAFHRTATPPHTAPRAPPRNPASSFAPSTTTPLDHSVLTLTPFPTTDAAPHAGDAPFGQRIGNTLNALPFYYTIPASFLDPHAAHGQNPPQAPGEEGEASVFDTPHTLHRPHVITVQDQPALPRYNMAGSNASGVLPPPASNAPRMAQMRVRQWTTAAAEAGGGSTPASVQPPRFQMRIPLPSEPYQSSSPMGGGEEEGAMDGRRSDDGGFAGEEDYTLVLSAAIEVLAELCLNHSGLMWYLYDHYPCLVYRMLDLIPTAIGHYAVILLEHIFSFTGPIIEIAKEPDLIRILEGAGDYVFALLCRILVPLVLPGEVGSGGAGGPAAAVSSMHPASAAALVHKVLLFPEPLTPMYRVQRVIDSNVLWLQSSPRFMDRILALATQPQGPMYWSYRMAQTFARELGLNNNNNNNNNNAGGAAENVGIVAGFLSNRGPPGVADPETPIILQNLRGQRNTMAAAMMGANGSAAMVGLAELVNEMHEMLEATGDISMTLPLQQSIQELESVIRRGAALGADRSSYPVPAGGTGGRVRGGDRDPAVLPDAAAEEGEEDEEEYYEEGEEDDDDEELEEEPEAYPPQFFVDTSWLFGQYNTIQRWQARDQTLYRCRDDNQEALFGPIHLPHRLKERLERLPQSHIQRQVITDAQREGFCLISTCLCTFFFSNAFHRARECQLVRRANQIFDGVFGKKSREAQGVHHAEPRPAVQEQAMRGHEVNGGAAALPPPSSPAASVAALLSAAVERCFSTPTEYAHYFNAPPSPGYLGNLDKALDRIPASMAHLPDFHPTLRPPSPPPAASSPRRDSGSHRCPRYHRDNAMEDAEVQAWRAAHPRAEHIHPCERRGTRAAAAAAAAEEEEGAARDAERCRMGALYRQRWAFPCFHSLLLHAFLAQAALYASVNVTLLLDESAYQSVGDRLSGGGGEADAPTPLSIRKWEFLRCLSEYWNAQNLEECWLVTKYNLPSHPPHGTAASGGGSAAADEQAAREFVVKTVGALLKRHEDCTVEADCFAVVERYIRTYAMRCEADMQERRRTLTGAAADTTASTEKKERNDGEEGDSDARRDRESIENVEEEIAAAQAQHPRLSPPPPPPIRYTVPVPAAAVPANQPPTTASASPPPPPAINILDPDSDGGESGDGPLVEVRYATTTSRRSEDQWGKELLYYRRCDPDVPNVQDEVGYLLLPSLLKDRLYNATVVPGTSASLVPLWRTEKANAALSELLLYHYRHLQVLCDYVSGKVSMEDGVLPPVHRPATTPAPQALLPAPALHHRHRHRPLHLMVTDTSFPGSMEFEYEEEIPEETSSGEVETYTASTSDKEEWESASTSDADPDPLRQGAAEQHQLEQAAAPPRLFQPLYPPGSPASLPLPPGVAKAAARHLRHLHRSQDFPYDMHPPLERGEKEAFGSVLLRRLYTLGFYIPFLPRCLALSLTPGLRSGANYVYHKQRAAVRSAEATADAANHRRCRRHPQEKASGGREAYVVLHRERLIPPALLTPSPSSEFLWKMYVHLTRIRRISRRSVETICRYLEAWGPHAEPEAAAVRRHQHGVLGRLLRRMLEEIEDCPYGPSHEEHKPLCPFFDEDDWKVLWGRTPRSRHHGETTETTERAPTAEAEAEAEAEAAAWDLPALGPPRTSQLPLFDAAIRESEGLAHLRPLADSLLAEPHRLLYTILAPLQAEAVNSTHRLCITTTALIIVMREGKLFGGAAGIRRLLRRVQRLQNEETAVKKAQAAADGRGGPHIEQDLAGGEDTGMAEVGGASYPTQHTCMHWPSTAAVAELVQMEVAMRCTCICGHRPTTTASQRRRGQEEANSRRRRAASTPSLPSRGPAEGRYRPARRNGMTEAGPPCQPQCPSRLLFGTCHPSNAALAYHRRHGGCFFKNLFRLLCVWLGHYAVVQRYVVTLFFSTEISFLDYKTVALFLLRELPFYFSPARTEEEDEMERGASASTLHTHTHTRERERAKKPEDRYEYVRLSGSLWLVSPSHRRYGKRRAVPIK